MCPSLEFQIKEDRMNMDAKCHVSQRDGGIENTTSSKAQRHEIIQDSLEWIEVSLYIAYKYFI
jgi:hypothetical protein